VDAQVASTETLKSISPSGAANLTQPGFVDRHTPEGVPLQLFARDASVLDLRAADLQHGIRRAAKRYEERDQPNDRGWSEVTP
jgi:hypothetical protein